jgi:branched-chain amino acid transport system permease protein
VRAGIVTGGLAAVVVAILLMGAGDQTGPSPFVMIGLVNGAVYGLVGIGLVLVYKGTRVFNFAQGEFGSLAAYFVYLLFERNNMPYGVAVLLALVGALLVGLTMERVIVRPLLSAPRVSLLVATIATALLFIGIEILIFRIEPLSLSPLIPLTDAAGEARGITLFDFTIDPMRMLIVGTLLGLGVLLAWFFSKTDLGLAVLATSQDAFATRVVGIGVERMSRFIWGSAALLGGVAGILYVPPIAGALVPAVMTTNVLIPAFTGAVIGGMTSLPGAFLGGTVVGLVQALSLWAAGHYYFGTTPIQQLVPGAEQISILMALLIILLARPQGLLGKEA